MIYSGPTFLIQLLLLNLQNTLQNKIKACLITRVETTYTRASTQLVCESSRARAFRKCGAEEESILCESMHVLLHVYNSLLCEEGFGGFWVTCFRGQVSTLLICGLFHFNTLSRNLRPTHLPTLHPPSTPSRHKRMHVGNLSSLKSSELNFHVIIRYVNFLIYTWER